MALRPASRCEKAAARLLFLWAAFHEKFKKVSCLRFMGNVFNMKSVEKAGSESAGSYFF
ncbi:hypothetical protein [Comamonas jiangduensis]|uniref:hypothetical protein n=1 Tax=Comamonas jiangduensis TaxID=1194168 RepID=UPI0028AAAB61|nr:hypothetical protein [Comamonas jiangduensis]